VLSRRSDPTAWLRTYPSLDELRAAYPREWTPVERADLKALRTMAASAVARRRELVRARSRSEEHALIAAEVRRQMSLAKLRQIEAAIEMRATEKLAALKLVPEWFRMQLKRRPR
jgi:hypothetical protein